MNVQLCFFCLSVQVTLHFKVCVMIPQEDTRPVIPSHQTVIPEIFYRGSIFLYCFLDSHFHGNDGVLLDFYNRLKLHFIVIPKCNFLHKSLRNLSILPRHSERKRRISSFNLFIIVEQTFLSVSFLFLIQIWA